MSRHHRRLTHSKLIPGFQTSVHASQPKRGVTMRTISIWESIEFYKIQWKSMEIRGPGSARHGTARLGSARLGLARPSICQRFATDLLRILQQFVDYSSPICRRFADSYHRRSTDEPVYRRADYCTTWDFLSLYFGWIWI